MPAPPLCSYCRQRPAEARWRPFCSERCKMADLGRWLSGDYRIAVTSADEGDDVGTGSLAEDHDGNGGQHEH